MAHCEVGEICHPVGVADEEGTIVCSTVVKLLLQIRGPSRVTVIPGKFGLTTTPRVSHLHKSLDLSTRIDLMSREHSVGVVGTQSTGCIETVVARLVEVLAGTAHDVVPLFSVEHLLPVVFDSLVIDVVCVARSSSEGRKCFVDVPRLNIEVTAMNLCPCLLNEHHPNVLTFA